MNWDNISVRLDANISGFVSKIGAASGAVRGFGREVAATAANTDAKTRQVTANVGKLMLGVGGAATLALGFATTATMGFDKALSNLSAVSNASTAEMKELRQAALDAGQATVFSASQAATAAAELARAGVANQDILSGGLRGAVDLAAAGQLELKDAATLTAQALNVFNLSGGHASRVADTLAAGANKSAADVSQLGEALRMGGLVARQIGLTLEDTTGVLSLFADNALIGSDAGTSLKTMLQRLVPSTKESAAMMKHLGLNFFDAQGRFIGITKTAGLLQRQLGHLSQEQRLTAFTTVFGADAIRSANILYSEGEAGVRRYIAAVTDQGAAQRMAAEQLDNLAGDLEQFKGSLETAFIETGSKATGVLRGVVQWSTSAVNGFLALSPAAQNVASGLTLATAAVGLLSGGFLLLGPRVANALQLYRQLITTAPALATAIRLSTIGVGVLGGALVAGTMVLAAYGREKAKARQLTDEFAAALQRETQGLDQEAEKLLAEEVRKRGLVKSAKELGLTTADVTNAVLGQEGAWGRLQRRLKDGADSYGSMSIEQRKQFQELARLVDHVEDLRAGYASGKVSAKEYAEAANELGVKTEQLGAAQAGALDPTADLTAVIEAQKQAAEEDAKRVEGLAEATRSFLGAESALATVAARATERTSSSLQERHQAEKDALDERHRRERDGIAEQARIVGAEGKRVNDEAERVLRERQEVEDRALAKRQDAERKASKDQEGSLAEFAAELEAQAAAAVNWQQNLLVVARRFGPQAAREMAELGKKGAGKVAELAKASDAEGRRVAAALTKNAELEMNETGAVLDRGFTLMEKLAGDGGQKVADRFLERLREGKVPLAELVAEFVALLTPLSAPGSEVKTPAGTVVSVRTADGRERAVRDGRPTNVIFEASGGFESHVAQTAPAGAWRVWAEPETGGETYIPHAPSKRARSTAYLAKTARLFGYRLERYADGGSTASAGSAVIVQTDPTLATEIRHLRVAIGRMGGRSSVRQYNFGGIHGLSFEDVMRRAERQAALDSLAGVDG